MIMFEAFTVWYPENHGKAKTRLFRLINLKQIKSLQAQQINILINNGSTFQETELDFIFIYFYFLVT